MAARYGWHGTICPPFQLGEGLTPAHLLTTVQLLANSIAPFDLAVAPTWFRGFIALRPALGDGDDWMGTIASQALQRLFPLRRPLSPSETERRRTPELTKRQGELLTRWGYPYVLDEFLFHMTLTDPVADPEEVRALIGWWQKQCDRLGPVPFDNLALFVEREPDEPFMLWTRIPLLAGVSA
ncbi:hypothetical protein J3E64_002130 [Sphingobium sp. OAS761]|uniref:DUF1045 domain-containing protein n=1 Tax=Sphingobium sp. OAS761 TaxID=2817901 RepID=UPI00209D6F70|nr:DUF1045 domain-containing protein [Sphingobium sp. OAS761]MCP1470442.1 hypothetical protein [Sphingobium sp. OAS761]